MKAILEKLLSGEKVIVQVESTYERYKLHAIISTAKRRIHDSFSALGMDSPVAGMTISFRKIDRLKSTYEIVMLRTAEYKQQQAAKKNYKILSEDELMELMHNETIRTNMEKTEREEESDNNSTATITC